MSIERFHVSNPAMAKIASDSLFITSASYEERCLTGVRAVAGNLKKAVVFWVANLFSTIEENLTKIEQYIGSGKVRKVATDISNPIMSASVIDQEVMALLDDNEKHDVVIDITTFTHEHLLFLLKSISARKEKIGSLRCIYSGAADYAYNEEGEKKWLSKGCAEVRSVVGYPGMIYPGVENVLIILVGYEHERAECVMDEMSPDSLYIGFGTPDSVTADAHRAPLSLFRKMLEENIAIRQNVHSFSFSANDPDDALKQLTAVIANTPHCNHIIVPMNTKLSTLAVAAIGLRNPDVQICYAQPETYNFAAYSKPSDNIHFLEGAEFILGR